MDEMKTDNNILQVKLVSGKPKTKTRETDPGYNISTVNYTNKNRTGTTNKKLAHDDCKKKEMLTGSAKYSPCHLLSYCCRQYLDLSLSKTSAYSIGVALLQNTSSHIFISSAPNKKSQPHSNISNPIQDLLT